jgi:hypothetical protein
MHIKTHQNEQMKLHVIGANVAYIEITPLWPHENID